MTSMNSEGAALGSAIVRARESLAAAQEASTQTEHFNGHVLYEEPLAALRDAQVASGQAALAVAEEMTAARAEIAQVAEAVRDLTKTLDAVLGELCSRVADVERTLDAAASETVGEVSEVCTELAEIGAAFQQRRRWRLWGGGRR